MNMGFRLFLDMVPIASLLLIFAFLTVLPYRKEPAAQSLIYFIGLVFFLLLASSGELLAPAGTATLLFAKLEYIPYLYIPVVWLSFCLRYTGWITYTNGKILIVAVVAPALAFLIVITNEWHGLLWQKIVYLESDGLSILRPVHGPLFWLYLVYSWSFNAFGTVLVIRSFFSGQRLYYRQSMWILAGSIIPGITNLLNVASIMPGIAKDFTPIGFALSAVCFLAGIYIHRLLWIMPVARGVLIQELGIGVIALDAHGWIVDHNRKADEMLGLKKVSVGSRSEDFPALEALFSSAGFTPGNARDFLGSGHMKWEGLDVSWSIQPAVRGCVIVLEDITEKVRLHEEMEKIRHELVNREKLATVGRLTAGLAHEINNPVGYLKSDVRSLSRLVERQKDSDQDATSKEIASICAGITDGLDRIENVVRSLLDFSRQDKIDSPFERYNLYTGIDTTIDIMRYELHDTIGIRKVFGEIPLIYAQKNEINQVILNLLTNACHGIRDRAKGESFAGLITIRTGMSDATVWCEIENNGAPIPIENRDRIFDLFFTTREAQWGTGLGLNICRDIIENHHGGKLLLVSLDPVVFRIELPARANQKGENTVL